VVAQEMRRNGLAAEILAEASRTAREAGAERIELHAQTYAHELYERDGYEDVGERFFEEGIEHVSMQKTLA
jgi:predicted GNAT family N-acyltransferase